MSTTTNKKTAVKGAVAAAAGIAVLLGGAGTFALWNDSAIVGAGESITAGQLDVAFAEDATWTDVTGGTPKPITDIKSFRMVPGDKLERTSTGTLTAQGDNIKVHVDSEWAADAGIPDEFGENVDVDVILYAEGSQTPITEVSNGTFPVTVKVTVNYDSAGDNAGQTHAVNLGDLSVKVTQVADA